MHPSATAQNAAPSYGDHDYLVSHSAYQQQQQQPQQRGLLYDSWATAMPGYLAPLTEATLNGQAYSNAHATTLPGRIRAIEEEIYGYAPAHHADQSLGRYAPENTRTTTTSTEHKRKRGALASKEADNAPPQHKRPNVEHQNDDSAMATGGDSDDEKNEEGGGDNGAGKDTYKAVRSRESSRRYRQRKKECFETMKRQVERYEDERRQWAKESDAAHKVIEQLTQENEGLKDKHQSDAIRVREERLALLSQLEEKVRVNAPDQELIPLLVEVKARCGGIKALAQSLLRQFISPEAAIHLARAGFFREGALEIHKPSQEQSMYGFAAKVAAELPDLTEAQQIRIHAHVEGFYLELRRLVDERQLLAQDIEAIKDGLDGEPDSVVGRLSIVQQLRENLIAESDLSLTTIQTMLDELTLMQAARFLVKAHFVHAGVMQLQMLWDALKHTPKALPLCPLSKHPNY